MAEKAEKAQATSPDKAHESEPEGVQRPLMARGVGNRWDGIFLDTDRKHEATIEEMKARFIEAREKIKQDSQVAGKEQILSLLKTIEERRDLEAKIFDAMLKIIMDVERMGMSLQEAFEAASDELDAICEQTEALAK